MGCAIRSLTLLLLLPWLLQSAPLHLEASTARSEFVRGDRLTISAYLFNDSADPISGRITILSPPGMTARTPQSIASTVAPGRALHVDFGYRIELNAPKGLARFVVTSAGMVREVWIRVGPIESKPPPGIRLWLAMVRA